MYDSLRSIRTFFSVTLAVFVDDDKVDVSVRESVRIEDGGLSVDETIDASVDNTLDSDKLRLLQVFFVPY
jgi:hypothetical protein